MTGLQEAYYIIGIIFMGIMLIVLFALLAAVIVIRKKVTALSDTIHSKIETVTSVTSKGAALVKAITGVNKKKAH